MCAAPVRVAAGIVLAGCGSTAAGVGGTVVVGLGCNSGTGYQWQMTPSGDSVVTLSSSTGCEPTDSEDAPPGAAGYETWSGHHGPRVRLIPAAGGGPASQTDTLTITAT